MGQNEPDSDRDPTPYVVLVLLGLCFLAGLALLAASVFIG